MKINIDLIIQKLDKQLNKGIVFYPLFILFVSIVTLQILKGLK